MESCKTMIEIKLFDRNLKTYNESLHLTFFRCSTKCRCLQMLDGNNMIQIKTLFFLSILLLFICQKVDDTDIPKSQTNNKQISRFSLTLSGTYGCKSSHPYKFKIEKVEDSAIVVCQDSTKPLSKIRFDEFCIKLDNLQPSKFFNQYGKMGTTADFMGTLTLDYQIDFKKVSKNIKIRKGIITDKNFNSALDLIISMWSKDYCLPPCNS